MMNSNNNFYIDIKNVKDNELDQLDAIKEEIVILKEKPKSLIEKSSKNSRLIKDLKTTFKKDIENMNDVL